MNKSFRVLAITLLLQLTMGSAEAITVYRCVGDDRVLKFQDKPCLAAESGSRIELADPPPVSNPSAAQLPATQAEPTAPATSVSPQQALVPQIPSATLCTREDGSRYLSESGRGDQRLAPLGTLGVPNDSLADAYGGPDGIGVSAPGLREAPLDDSRRGRLGALYTRVEDPCERISGLQLCAFLGSSISDAERRLRLAFTDTRESARRDLESLHHQAEHCPR